MTEPFAAADRVSTPESPPDDGMVWVPEGLFTMGSDGHYPEEAPAHLAQVDGFWMDRHAITNDQFRRFVDATGYVTVAERRPNKEDYPGARPESLMPASAVFRSPGRRVDLREPYTWWMYVKGAHSPGGPSSCQMANYMANTWQGEFPIDNLTLDGFEWTAPVGSFPPNGYGLSEMTGNV
jgi:formylglycine-generating enzyme required for sulfatase activity